MIIGRHYSIPDNCNEISYPLCMLVIVVLILSTAELGHAAITRKSQEIWSNYCNEHFFDILDKHYIMTFTDPENSFFISKAPYLGQLTGLKNYGYSIYDIANYLTDQTNLYYINTVFGDINSSNYKLNNTLVKPDKYGSGCNFGIYLIEKGQ